MPRVRKDRVKGICPVCGAKVSGRGRVYCEGCQPPITQGSNKLVYRPDHPNANESGYIFEHRLIAAQKLGRPLKPGEVVYRLDGTKTNNDPENLRVFPSMGDLTRYRARQRREKIAAGLEQITRQEWLHCWYILDRAVYAVGAYLRERGYSRRVIRQAEKIIGPLRVKEVLKPYWQARPQASEKLMEIAKQKEPLLFEAIERAIRDLRE